MAAMKQADPAAQIGVPWAFGSDVAGASVPDNTEWNNTVLGQDGRYVSFVDAHYYPFSFGGATGGSNPTDQQVLQSLMSVPSLYRQIRGELDAYDPRAQVVVGETGVSNNETTTVCTPTGALFAAGDVLSWLAAGAQSVDWWDMNNYGNTSATCTSPDYGMFTSASPPVAETPYYGYLLASVLARPNALLATMGTSDPADVLAYPVPPARRPGSRRLHQHQHQRRADGHASVPAAAVRPAADLDLHRGQPERDELEHRPGHDERVGVAHGITLPPESMVILETQ